VFEGMRGVLLQGEFDWNLLFGAVALNAVYVAAGAGIFFAAFRGARQRGALLQMGE
jgi:ABC-2 type transport system permease protein